MKTYLGEVQLILSRYAHDVVHAYDLGHRSRARSGTPSSSSKGQPDILVTYNRRDFRLLHQFWTALNAWGNLDQRHAGLLTSWGDIPDEPWANLVHDFVSQAPDLDNQMWEWLPQQQKWRTVSGGEGQSVIPWGKRVAAPSVRGDWPSLRFDLFLLRHGSSVDALIVDELNDSVAA